MNPTSMEDNANKLDANVPEGLPEPQQEEGNSMMSTPSWLSDELLLDKPSAARMYDYFLGGYHNFAIDRMAAEQVRAVYPDTPLVMQANRAFLRRAVKFLVKEGIDQFLDLASVIPTVGSVHEVAQQLNPVARVVYADLDPDSVRHSELILHGISNTAALQLDIHHPEQVLNHPDARRLIDFSQPVGVLLGPLVFVPDDEEAYNLVRVLRDAMVSGSYLAISHATNEGPPREAVEQAEKLYARTTSPVKTRTRAEVEHFFDGFELVEPGLVFTPLWQPESPDDVLLNQPERSAILAGVARKP